MRTETIAERLWFASLAVLAAGFAVLLLYALSEVLANPGTSLVDGYWIGRVPWTPLGLWLAFGGANAALLFGTLSVWLAGPWVLRLLTLPGLLAAAFWWFIALLFDGGIASAACCEPHPQWDIITIVYSVPQAAILFILVPALVASAIALLALRRPGHAKAAPAPQAI